MRLLLDTNIYLWYVKDNLRLSAKARAMVSEANEVYVSNASIWEVAIKAKLGKLEVDIDELVGTISASGFLEVPISAKHAAPVSKLPDLHRDPFDRMLIAQAIQEPLTLLTVDNILKKYSELVEII